MSDLACSEFVELVTAFIEGGLDPDMESRFVDHLALCPGCEGYLDQIRQTIHTLGELPEDRLSEQARHDLLSAFRNWTR
ncbi:anti-sigma factor family protein [Tenggerimyces flavus]|uniref:Anti-sigma factor family protein n=1 Tax=Tenggerimyces flavus TaxID=1708749 RepID=A0ABV7YH88_9ACTN|nr:zf-HC2 domain-containing protein [Tenggerimyces flavus]MBM7790035.1 anti-sigma factor RsiW [Tenggerimyces flavus]